MKFLHLITLPILVLILLGHKTIDSPISEHSKAQESQNDYGYVDTLMTDFLNKTKLPGVSIAVNQAGNILYSKGFGYADVKRQIAMTPTSQIRTASVAKVLTATALGKLASDGKLDFDKPLKTYIPDIKAPYANLTVRQIAGHTAGIPHRPASEKDKRKHYKEVNATMPLFKDLPLLFEPDTDYKYSTLAYNLLAILIQDISGKRYVDYMKEDIFLPLDMTQTFPDKKSEYADQDAKMYYFKKGKLTLDKKIYDGSYKLAGAGFRSTSIDLAKMMNAYSNGFIAAEVVETMFNSNILENEEPTNVGIAWRLNKDVNNNATIEHAGSWQGARTVIVYYPESELSISIMINAKCTIFIEETAHIIAQLFLDKRQTDKDLIGIDESLEINNNRSDGTIEVYEGNLKFSSPQKGELTIATDRDWLKKNTIYYLSAKNNFVLSTQYGLMYLNLKLEPTLEGKLFQYQVLNDPYHISQKPMLHFQAKK